MMKKALLVGINEYRDVRGLKGCVNDVTNMHNVLKTYFDFEHRNIRVLTDRRATKREILTRLEWLVDGAKAGDLLVFHFAGYGSQVLDRDEFDELEGRKDEILCPWDMDWDSCFIRADDLHRAFRELEEGVLLEVILDCCHSGTGTRSGLAPQTPGEELPGQFRSNRYLEPPADIECRSLGETYRIRGFRSASRSTLNHVLWAGCTDWQESADTCIGGEYSGAFSYYFCKHIRTSNGGISRRELLTRIANSLRFNRYRQEPQLECDSDFEMSGIFSPGRTGETRSSEPEFSSRREFLNGLARELGLTKMSKKKRREWFGAQRKEGFEILRTDALTFSYAPKEDAVFDRLELPRTRSLRGAGMNVANFFESLERHFEYLEKKDIPGICRIVAEGDSWFLHPLLEDTLDWLGKDYAIACLSAAGDCLREMLMQNDFVNEIIYERPQFFLLSGGGNDILGEESFKYCLKPYTIGEPGRAPARFLQHLFYDKLDEVLHSYRRVFKRIGEHPDIATLYDIKNPLHILIHGYDHVIPGSVKKGRWLRVKMLEKGISDPLDQNAVARLLIDRLNRGLEILAEEFNHTAASFRVHYVNLRGTLEQKAGYDIVRQKALWYDEIHPTSEGYQYVADIFKRKIEGLLGADE